LVFYIDSNTITRDYNLYKLNDEHDSNIVDIMAYKNSLYITITKIKLDQYELNYNIPHRWGGDIYNYKCKCDTNEITKLLYQYIIHNPDIDIDTEPYW
jgi:hypothetical protein